MTRDDEAQPVAGPSRRHLAKAAVWATPIALTAVSAPALAASSPEIGGAIAVSSSCSLLTQTFTINGSSAYPTHGIWMSRVPSTPTPTATSMTFYYPTTLGVLTWTRVGSTGTTWSLPARDVAAPTISGYYAYTSLYTGTWSYDTANRRLYNVGRPNFQAVRTGLTCVSPVAAYSLRRITLSGKTYSVQRGPTTIG